jgi:hypothetical protein
MRNLLLAGTAGISFVLGATTAFAAAPNDKPWPGARQLVEGRAAYEPAGEFGQIGNDFGPRFDYGAPASAKDFDGAEVSADAVVIK